MKTPMDNIVDNRTVLKGRTLSNTLWQYARLKEMLEHPAQQSWYFQKGIESRQKALEKFAATFEVFRNDVNSDNLDMLLTEKIELETHLAKFHEKGGPHSFMQAVGYGAIINKLGYTNCLLRLKSRFGKLAPLSYYLKHPKDMEELTTLDYG
jgi:hypothetical protein